MEQSSYSIVEQTGLDRKRVLRALVRIWTTLAQDVPIVFSGTVEVDETYLGGAWRNKRRVIRDNVTRRRGVPRINRYSAFSAGMNRCGQSLSRVS
jgi:hypothetical protein